MDAMRHQIHQLQLQLPSSLSSATLSRFVTELPQWDTECVNNSLLFQALGALQTQAAAWTSHIHCSDLSSKDGDCDANVNNHEKSIANDIQRFFETFLAPAIRDRETALVNIMHDCFQSELKAQQQKTQRLAQELEILVYDHEKETTHLKSKVDRRIAQNNALRKDYYKQLLMLREMVNKQKYHDPKTTMKALDDALGALSGREIDTSATMVDKFAEPTVKIESDGSRKQGSAVLTGAQSIRREKEKWEERAREAMSECQALQEQVLQLKQELEEVSNDESKLWFMGPQNGIHERQRIIDAVYRSKCTWIDVGGALVEMLNNDLIWGAVEERGSHHEKSRIPRGLEAFLTRINDFDSGVHNDEAASLNDSDALKDDSVSHRLTFGRPSLSAQSGCLIPCRSCNGSGYIDTTVETDYEADSYLRKTLAQVLELKEALTQSNARSTQLEEDLLMSINEGVKVKEKLEEFVYNKMHAIDSCLQVDLDEEEEIDLDEIMNFANNSESNNSISKRTQRSKRISQYEHLIVELKNSLTDKEAGIAELRTTLEDLQNRLVVAQRASQKEQESYQQEVTMLKTSLAIALKDRNAAIEEKQVAVKVMLKKLAKQQTKNSTLVPITYSGSDSDDLEDDSATFDITTAIDEHDEVKRAEMIARRYSEAVIRVQKEYEDQKVLLKQAEDEISQEDDKRKRTNSITLGSIVVSAASHPRDLFKALSSAQSEILSMRRASQRSSTLQTDRLLTLTTHLGHISEELSMVRKRASAELEYWKLECEKLQNSNKALILKLQRAQYQLQNVQDHKLSATSMSKGCSLCDKHQARLMEISKDLLRSKYSDTSTRTSEDQKGVNITAASSPGCLTLENATISNALTESDRRYLGNVIMEIEDFFATLSAPKREQAQIAITHGILGENLGNVGVSYELLRSATNERRRSGPQVSPSYPLIATKPRRHTVNSNIQIMTKTTSTIMMSQNELEIGKESDAKNQQVNFVEWKRAGNRLILDENETNQSVQWATNDSACDGTASPHRRKTIRKILSEEEVKQRYLTKSRRLLESDNCNDQKIVDDEPCGPDQDTSGTSPNIDMENSVLLDAEDEDVCNQEPRTLINAQSDKNVPGDAERAQTFDQDNDTDNNMSLPLRLTKTPSLSDYDYDHPVTMLASDENDTATGQDHQSTPQCALNPESENVNSSDYDHDPEAVKQLRELIQQDAVIKTHIAITSWKVLVGRIIALWDQNRLDQITKETKKVDTSRRLNRLQRMLDPENNAAGSHCLLALQSLMQKRAKSRGDTLDEAIERRDQMRKDLRRLRTHLIYNVSTLLTNISKKNKTSLRTSPFTHIYTDPDNVSPRRSPTYNRPLYPAALVNMSQIPSTQQIPTAHFPVPSSQGNTIGSSTTSQCRPSSASSCYTGNSGEGERTSPQRDDRRFPQRRITFATQNQGVDFTLAHSTSGIISPPGISPTNRQYDSTRFDILRRAVHNATSKKVATVCEQVYRHFPKRSDTAEMHPRNTIPARPKSSPAQMTPRTSAIRSQQCSSPGQFLTSGDKSQLLEESVRHSERVERVVYFRLFLETTVQLSANLLSMGSESSEAGYPKSKRRQLISKKQLIEAEVLLYAQNYGGSQTSSDVGVTSIILSEGQLRLDNSSTFFRVITFPSIMGFLQDLDLSHNNLPDNFWGDWKFSPSDSWPAMTSLNVSNNRFTAQSVPLLAEIVSKCPNLAKLDMSLNPISTTMINCLSPLFHALGSHNRLCELDVSCLKLSVQVVTDMLSSSCAAKLEKLYLRSAGLDDEVGVTIAKVLPSLVLQVVSLAGNQIRNHGASALAFALDQTQSLQTLDLDENEIGEPGLMAFYHVLNGMQEPFSLRYLHLNRNRAKNASEIAERIQTKLQEKILEIHITKVAARHGTTQPFLKLSGSIIKQVLLLRSVLTDHYIKVALNTIRSCDDWNVLEELDLSGNTIGVSGCYDIGLYLSLRPPLRILNLSNNRIDDNGIIGLAEGLEPNETLKELNLYHNLITDTGAKELYLKAFTSNLQRKILLSTGNALTLECKVMLAAISQAHDIRKRFPKEYAGEEKLEFVGKSLRQYGAAAIVEVLLTIPCKCKSLDISRNGLGDEGAREIAHLLKNYPQLEKVDLSFNEIGDFGAMALADALAVNTTLTSFSLHSTVDGSQTKPKLMEQGLSYLAQVFQKHKSIVSLDLRDNITTPILVPIYVQMLRSNPNIQKFNGATAAVYLSRYGS